MSRLDFQPKLRNAGLQIPFIFLSGYGDILMTVKAMGREPWNLWPSLLRINTCSTPLGKLSLAIPPPARSADFVALRERYDKLTPREREVMGLVVSGMLNKQIA